MQKWVVINKKADFKGIGQKYGIDQVTARIIRNRDVIEDEGINRYLNGGMSDLYDPHLLKDSDILITILKKKILDNKKIRIIGDYDIETLNEMNVPSGELVGTTKPNSFKIVDNIEGYVIGEHGDSQMVAWSHVTVGGKPILQILEEQKVLYK